MIRRALLVAAAAVALSLAPSTAMADYGASSFHCTVSDSTPSSGVPFTFNMSGGARNAQVTLSITNHVRSMGNQGIQIAGNKSHTNTSDASGALAWTVTLMKAGTYGMTATNAAGSVVGTQSVTVSPAEAVAGAPAAPAAPAAGVTGQLGKTGFGGTGLAVGGGALVLAGSGAVLVARRRRSAKVPA